ncbi:MAG: hypothetical protein ACP5D7_11410 [Limnospira sp.]
MIAPATLQLTVKICDRPMNFPILQHLEKVLTQPEPNPYSPRTLFWFFLSLAFTVSFAIPVLKMAFSSEYIIMDDARQYLFWMQRFSDPELFPNDLIADFYQSAIAPGVSAFYWVFARLGIEPLVLNRLLPVVLGLVTTAYCFAVCFVLLPIPVVGFLGSLLLSQNLWLNGELVTAISTGFLYPTFMAFLYYLLRRSWVGVAICTALVGLCYGPLMLVGVGVLVLWPINWYGWLFRFSQNRRDYIISGVGISVAIAVIFYYLSSVSEFGPTITVAEATLWPEFGEDGRVSFFEENAFWSFWFKNSRSGFRLSFNPPILALGLLLPVLLKFRDRFPLAKQINDGVTVIADLTVSSIFLFFTAHILLFKLFLPSRYTIHSFRIILAISTAIALMLLLDCGLRKLRDRPKITATLIAVIGILIIFYPPLFWKSAFPRKNYIIGAESGLYMFLQNQPKDTVVATLAIEADNIPSFGRRSVLISWEHSLPYQLGYYRKIRRRAKDFIRAHYTSDVAVMQDFVNTYNVDFIVLENDAFEAEFMTENLWFVQWKDLAEEAQEKLLSEPPPILLSERDRCTIFATDNLTVVSAPCLIQGNSGS